MKFLLVLFISVSSFAADPLYFKSIKGTTAQGLFIREKISANMGQLSGCVNTGVKEYKVYKCDVKDASATIENEAGKKIEISFSKLVAIEKVYRGQTYLEYDLLGEYSEDTANVALRSATKLFMLLYPTDPNNVKGTLSMEDIGIQVPFVAVAN